MNVDEQHLEMLSFPTVQADRDAALKKAESIEASSLSAVLEAESRTKKLVETAVATIEEDTKAAIDLAQVTIQLSGLTSRPWQYSAKKHTCLTWVLIHLWSLFVLILNQENDINCSALQVAAANTGV